jgi:hypothetical protein
MKPRIKQKPLKIFMVRLEEIINKAYPLGRLSESLNGNPWKKN